ncbi:MAG TPA: LysR substrate-binding domain-containing protein [Tepidisphaeraceae bacterium]|jgi:DNA-binding transcriptional LysR family regulator
MNRTHLTAFHAVSEAGSFSKGAERLLVSQPAVSQQVGELEAALGTQLFDRLPKGVRLTAAGEVLASYARRLAAIEQEAERAMQEVRGLRRGRLAVGASTTIGAYLLPRLLGEFRRQHPSVELEVDVANTESIRRKVTEGQLDLGLTEGAVGDETGELESRAFFEDELVAVAPPDHPLLKNRRATAKAFCARPMVMRERGSGTREVIERALAGKGLAVEPTLVLASTEAIKATVAAGVGVAFVSRLAVGLEQETGRLARVPLADLSIHRPLHLLRLKSKSQSAATAAFLSLLNERPAPKRGPKR